MNVLSGFRFATWPALLLLLPLVAVVLLARWRQRRTAVVYSDTELLKTLPVTAAMRAKRTLPWLKCLGLALVVLALARPQCSRTRIRINTQGVAIAMCIDRSGSMQAMDFRDRDGKLFDRLTAVKRAFRSFVEGTGKLPGRPSDLIGLVAFGGFAEAKCPLTLDHGALLDVLESVEIPQPIYDARGRAINARLLEEEMATAIGDAVVMGVDRLRNVTAKSKVLILLSDGEHNAGVVDPSEAADAARAAGIKIYTIGIGTTGYVPFPQEDMFGRPRLVKQRVVLDEETLKMLAQRTGGRYFNAANTQALTEVYADIDKLEKSAVSDQRFTNYGEKYHWLLVPGLVLILLELLLGSTWFRSLP